MAQTTAPYGTWPSPVSVEVVLKSVCLQLMQLPPSRTNADGRSQGVDATEIFVDPITSTIYHIESRPAEEGRCVIVNTEKGEDVVGKEWNVRTGVHEVRITVR